MVLVRVLLVRCYVVWFVVICRFTCVQVLVVLFTSPGLSISLVVVFGTDKSGCGKLERSRVNGESQRDLRQQKGDREMRARFSRAASMLCRLIVLCLSRVLRLYLC